MKKKVGVLGIISILTTDLAFAFPIDSKPKEFDSHGTIILDRLALFQPV